MNTLEKMKAKRSVERTSLTKLITKLNTLLADDVRNTKLEELLEIRELLVIKENILKELNKEIENQISELQEYEKEIAASEKYEDELISAKFKIKHRLKLCDKSDDIHNSVNESSNSVNGVQSSNTCSAMKLPKLSIPKFTGEIEKWQEFFNCFETSIHENNNLSKIEKFAYLKSLLSDDAYRVVDAFPLTDSNYDTCLELLKDRYGKIDVIINKHMSNLLNLEQVNNSSNLNALRKLHDTCEINIRNLRNLGVTSSSYGHLLNPILLKLLPNDLVIEYHRKYSREKDANVTDLIAFLKCEIECREKALLMSNSKNDKQAPFVNKNVNKSYRANTLNANVRQKFCIFCKSDEHFSFGCKNLTEENKRSILKKEGRCYRCFLKSHLSAKCRVKLQPCGKCKSVEHNILFCNKTPSKSSENQTIVSNSHCNFKNSKNAVLLQTCCVNAQSYSNSKSVRLLLDSGSEKSFIMSSLAQELNLPVIRKEHLTVFAFGIDQGREEEYDVYRVKLRSKINRRFINVEVLGTNIISATNLKVPNSDPEISKFIENKKWKLADPSLNESPVQILLGADYFWRVQKGVVQEINDHLYVANTIFGYTIVGKINSQGNEIINSHFVSVNETENFDLQHFWNLESLGISDSKNERFSQNDLNTLELFNDNLNFVNGRYETKLLWKVNKNELASNFQVAKHRLLGLKSKLCKNDWLYQEYENILNEQCNLGIIEECKFNENEINTYYMPHRPVIRNDKSTTKVRIVFDASSKDTGEKSLNDCLISGPNLNPNILDIILRFRLHKIAFSGDIEKAFLQIQIAEEDRNFLRFLWFESTPNDNYIFKGYRMTRVSFGVTTSPFFLSATIKHHIKGYKDLFEKVVNMLDSSLYVDDLFYGADSVNEAFILSSGAEKILSEAKMKLRKFKSNSTDLRELWKNHGMNIEEDNHEQIFSKVLGIIWDTERDILKLDIQPLLTKLTNKNITKRVVLQTAAKIYDPLGLISPFVVRIKFLMQSVWELGIDWDSTLPDSLQESFIKWCEEVKDIANFEIPRQYFVNTPKLNPEAAQLFVFCDASLKGYGSVAYIRDPLLCDISFVMSKSRVAPLKKITLPRLELLGALVAARMASFLRGLLKIANENLFCYTDSQIVLHWIRGSHTKWKPFVANRVREIQELVAPTQWKFCKGTENPADVLSRGCSASELLKNNTWTQGPMWLKNESLLVFYPETTISPENEEILQEQRKVLVCPVSQDKSEFDLLFKFSSWTKLKRIVAWCLRFIRNVRFPSDRITGFLTVPELEQATNIIVKLVQKHEFDGELKVLKSGKNLNSGNKLLPLHPFVDKKDILRVGGRLKNANLPESKKYPMILPKKHHVTDLIVKYFHENHLHGGSQLTVSAIRQNFWIINAKDAVKRNIRKCMKCFRNRPNLSSQLMGDLPAARVTPSRIFSIVGTDMTGPFMIRPRKGRGVKPLKHYVCIFICFSTKAIHLEMVSDLSTETFLASLKRFVARRGKPQEIYSDRGTNFVGADSELKKIMSQITSDEKIHQYFADEMIAWKFNPPSAPHFGGIWEGNIKQMKYHLKRTIGEQILTSEEFLTLIVQIEACLNSRPLVALSNDPNDLTALTPGHFIIGAPLTSLPESDVTSVYIPPLQRWKLVQGLVQSFWKRWSSDYLAELQQRSKWRQSKPNLNLNDLVLIKDDNQPPLRWKMGRIIEVYPGKDNHVRVVKLKTANGELKRAVHKLAPLPFQ